jgi:RecA/RadA recombinase
MAKKSSNDACDPADKFCIDADAIVVTSLAGTYAAKVLAGEMTREEATEALAIEQVSRELSQESNEET